MVTKDDLRILQIYLDHLSTLGIVYEQSFPKGTYNLKCSHCRKRWTMRFNPFQIPKINDDYYKCPGWDEKIKACGFASTEKQKKSTRLGVPLNAKLELWSRRWVMRMADGQEREKTFNHMMKVEEARRTFRLAFFPSKRQLPAKTIVHINREKDAAGK